MLNLIARRLLARQSGHPLRVGVDGICGAGKSTFARELRAVLSEEGRPVVLVDSDGFHHARKRRHRQGRDSARGYYEDAYDFDSLIDKVLRPLGPGGSGQYAVRVHDLTSDSVVEDWAVAPPDAVVLFDATFIQRGRLRELWDEVIYLDADEEAAMARGVTRDAPALGGHDLARAAYDHRYMGACRIYLTEQDPRARASIVVDHTDPDAPFVSPSADPRRAPGG